MRFPVPGESDPFLGTRTEIPNVAITGTIASVDTRNGIIGVDLGIGIGYRPDVKLPLLQLSVLGSNSSWLRFMPQVGDVVTLVQNVNGNMHIVNFESINYKQLADADAADRFLFRELKGGEFEIRSSGLAAILGTREGILRLNGGTATLVLDRDGMEIDADAMLHKSVALACETRFGQVRRRLLPIDTEDSAVAGGVQREHRVFVARDVAGAAIPMVDAKLGDVVDDTTPFAPTIGSGGGPLRAHVRVYDAAGVTTAFELEVDALGNLEVTQSALATVLGIKLVGLLSSFLAQYKDFTFQPTTTIKLGGPGATEPVPLGTQLNTFLQGLTDALNSAVIATPMGPATFNPATLAALQVLKSTYLTSNVILSDVALTQKLPSPGSG